MCTVSDKIILCICEIKDVYKLKHFWILFRFNPDKGQLIIGQPFGFDVLLQNKNPDNPKLLCDRLNTGNLFDKPMIIEEKDRLHISIHFKENENPTDYGFTYNNGEWEIIEFDYFSWKYEHFEVREGKVKNVVNRQR